MAIQQVPPIDPALPDFPGPNTPEAQYDDAAYNWGSAIPGYGNRVKAIGDNVYNNATEAKALAEAAGNAKVLAEIASANAMGVANFKGDWASLSGALARPATVQHNGNIWLLMQDVPNVAAVVPGVSAAWKNLSGSVTLTEDQSIAGKKTFSERLKYRDPATLAQLTVGGTRSVVLNTASSQWITLCRFGGSNRPLYSRFILSCPARHWSAEITFSKTTAGAGGDSWASIRILGAYSYFFAYPYQYRISGYASNYSSFIEMRLPGFGSTSETYVLTVLEEYQTEDSLLIDYPLAVVEPGTTRLLPNALTFGYSGGLYYRYGEIICGGTYAPVIENNGASGQTTLESVA